MGNRNIEKPLLILGVGNKIQRDDGIGVHMIEQLNRMALPEWVELFDGGTAGFDLIPVLSNRKKVIVIDAVKGSVPAGTLFKFTPEDLENEEHSYDSLHQLGIIESLQMAKLMDRAPDDCVIFAVQPGVIEWGLTLTDSVESAIPKLTDAILREVDQFASTLSGFPGDQDFKKMEGASERKK